MTDPMNERYTREAAESKFAQPNQDNECLETMLRLSESAQNIDHAEERGRK